MAEKEIFPAFGVDVDAVAALRDTLRAINPSARVVDAPLDECERRAFFDPEGSAFGGGADDGRALPVGLPHGGASSVSLGFDGPVDWAAFGIWLSMLLHARGDDVLRVKGLLDVVGGPDPVLVNGVRHAMHPPEHLAAWPDEDHRSRIVFVTRGVEPEEVLASLEAFRGLLGARPRPLEG